MNLFFHLMKLMHYDLIGTKLGLYRNIQMFEKSYIVFKISVCRSVRPSHYSSGGQRGARGKLGTDSDSERLDCV